MTYALTKKRLITTLEKDEREIMKMDYHWSFWPKKLQWNFYNTGDIAIGNIQFEKQKGFFSTTQKYLLTLQSKQYPIVRHMFKQYFTIQDGANEYKVTLNITWKRNLSITKNGKQIATIENDCGFHWMKEIAVLNLNAGEDSQLLFAIVCFCRFGIIRGS